MGWRVAPRPWVIQPQQFVEVDPYTPAAAGLKFAFFPALGVDALSKTAPTSLSMARTAAGGMLGGAAKGTSARMWSMPTGFASPTGWTNLSWLAVVSRVGSGWTLGDYTSIVRRNGQFTPIQFDPGAGRYRNAWWSGGLQIGPYYPNPTRQTAVFWGTLAPSVAVIGTDDVWSSNAVTFSSIDSASNPWCLNGNESDGEIDTSIVVHLAALWNRTIPTADMRAVIANPWQIFAPAPRRIYVPAGGNVYNVSLSESGSAADSVSAQLAAVASLSEAGSATDSVSALAQLVASISESGSSSDAVSSSATLGASVSESGSATDSVTTGAQYSASITETASAADVVSALATLGASIAEAGNATDSVSALAVLVASLAETAAAGDGVSATAVLLAALAESGTATDSVSAGSGNIYSVTLAESGSAADSIVAALVAVAQLAEGGDAQDSVSAALQALGAISEGGAASDQVSAAATLLAQLLEAGSAQDVVYILQGIATSGQRGRVSGPGRTTIYGPSRTSINP